ncbi:MAG: NADH-dependent alcohol dehydrogenase [Candidatus Dactylopiibacterium carminicum]|uniref:NADH-dependent alcohol dehydrogenase n=1 Tax=Candidatus Dactylopiibacterium carminicum TaxID=857335 RepID=A0A272EQU1_9RHOO|nr:iron-containing alcohol dehydrogenase [Candidatus Dactylopiibacterium carminicum]KAF7599284.1 NADH-dependent alcohol dehydrogenase [Candidatus Dactylopiibacterium carminicum]PAS92446.1 MAG: NADH-dependent alcohol dehydrogenase [Candidatus Dactylopiibacterium carminicum]PAS97166.1 MAG: NADH-dependent alcohol dehydrogenase [Candidatus Dactylopiibacterium carminicum]PAS99290.1 MAG: NADH-dependent alcohol dehydrogenase [Candidatus Dactylopiibacterium carminicum]
MQNFSYYNPTRIIFGKGQIAAVAAQIPAGSKVLVTYGGGSIKRNGVYDQVAAALKAHAWLEFGGIEPNPRYETLMRAVEIVKREGVDFILAVGGGSVADGSKFIAAAALFEGADPWDILGKRAPVSAALPLGVVLTLPATGSESNTFAVISREATGEKYGFGSEHCYPRFAVLDPETTYSLPPRQVANGIVDAFVHTIEQYLTYPVGAELQDRFAEGILQTLIRVGPQVLAQPQDYVLRANLMWTATLALNGLIGCGVPQDWATHMIGHELTAEYGLDHARTLAVVLPGVWRHSRTGKQAKLLQFAERVWGLHEGSETERIEAAIERTEAFFKSLGVECTLAGNGVADSKVAAERISARLAAHGMTALGERGSIDPAAVRAILSSR